MAKLIPTVRNPLKAPSVVGNRRSGPSFLKKSLRALEQRNPGIPITYLNALADELEAAPASTPITQIVPKSILNALMPDQSETADTIATRQSFIDVVRKYSLPPAAAREVVRANLNRLLHDQMMDPEEDRMTTVKILAEMAKDPEVGLRAAPAAPSTLDVETVRRLAQAYTSEASVKLVEGKVDGETE